METEGRQIPNRLKKHRIRHELRQKDVAKLLGHKNASIVSKWENGEAVPGLFNLIKLSIIYSVLPNDLYFDVYKAQQEIIASKRQALFLQAES